MATKKIRVTLTLEVDPKMWELEYGIDETLHKDVKQYVLSQVQGSVAGDDEAIVSVTLA